MIPKPVTVRHKPGRKTTIFGDRLQEVRLARNLSHDALSVKSGVAVCTLTSYENRGALPKLAQAKAVALALGVSLDWLFDLPGGQPPRVRRVMKRGIAHDTEMQVLRVIPVVGGDIDVWITEG